MHFPSTVAPAGFLALSGQLISRTGIYANLWTFAQASNNIITESTRTAANIGAFTTGDGATTFRVPDARGIQIRALDNGKGTDAGRTIGSYQTDSFASHFHMENRSTDITYHTTAYAMGSDAGLATGYTNGTVQTYSTGGVETVGKNIALLACIKI
jgi:microcystin-dependent protein